MPFVPELNAIKKDWRSVDLKVALCYPNVYRTGMTGMTVRLLYALLNAREDVACERLFIPTRREPLRSLESNRPLKDFDVAAFSLQYARAIQAFLSLGNREVERAVELAARYGGRLGTWRRALRESKISLEKYTRRKEVDEPLPWDHVHVGLNRRFLIEENERARRKAAAHV